MTEPKNVVLLRKIYTKKNRVMPYTYEYPHPAVTTDCVVFGFDGNDLKVLLIERGVEPFNGMWALPGGFLKMDETAEESAKRELWEETQLETDCLVQLKTFSAVDRDPRERVVTVAFYALVKSSEVQGGDDAANAKWFDINELPKLAFDHEEILNEALSRLREDIHFKPVGFDLLNDSFTVPQLQRLYEAILGVNFDRRNFYKKMVQVGVIEPVEEDNSEHSNFFGEHKEMMMLSNFDSLFGENEQQGYSINKTSKPREARSVGRKGRLFRFNKERYDEMKRDGNTRLEF